MAHVVLIVEDETDLAQTLSWNLQKNGFETKIAHSGEEALERLAEAPTTDLVLLDWMLPDIPGTEVCRRIRQSHQPRDVPVIMLSARGEEIDRVVGFEVGVDDYVTKPFSVRELLLRVQAILSRRRRKPEPVRERIDLGPLTIDFEGYRVAVHGEEVTLTALEMQILRALHDAGGGVLSREDLVRKVWGPDGGVTTSAVDSHVKRLRQKLGDGRRCLQTVRGVGYSLIEAPAARSA